MLVNGNIVENEEQLHELLEYDYITYDEYMAYAEKLDEEIKRNKDTEIINAVKSTKRTNWKKLYLSACKTIHTLDVENMKLKNKINNMQWECSKYLTEEFYNKED